MACTRNIGALLFDMDGVLFDTERISLRAATLSAAEQGCEITWDFFKTTFGVPHKKLEGLYIRQFGPAFDAPRYTRGYWRHRQALLAAGVPVMKGVRETLLAAKAARVPCAVASSSPEAHVRSLVERAGLAEFFTALLGGDRPLNAKPAPDIYLEAARLVGVPIESCVVIEDSKNGLRAGRAAGARVLMVPDMIPPDDECVRLADRIEESLFPLSERLRTQAENQETSQGGVGCASRAFK